MVVILALGRCSPLNPSQSRSLDKTSEGALATRPSTEPPLTEENDINELMKDVSEQKRLPVLSQSDYTKFVSASLYADRELQPQDIRQIVRQRSSLATRYKTRLLSILLSPEQRQELLERGYLRINLAGILNQARTSEKARSLLFSEMQKQDRLEARAYLVRSDDAMQKEDSVSNLPVRIKTRLAYLSDDKYFLEVKFSGLDEAQNELIESNFASAIGLSIVFE